MSEAKLTSGRYHWFIPGDVVVNPLLPEEKGVILGFSVSGKYADILIRSSSIYGFCIAASYPIDNIKPTGEHVDISELVRTVGYEFKTIDKNKADHGKPPISLVPTGIIWEIAKVRDYGVNVKYPETGKDGWKEIDISRIRDAMLRHCLRYIEDPGGVDKESGLSHLSHLACNVAFLIEMEREERGERGDI